MTARGASRTRNDQVVRGLFGDLLATELGALRPPAAIEHYRQPVNDDVQETADAKADDQRGNDDNGEFSHVKASL